MGQLILVLGGARSGKSTFAQEMAGELGGEQVLFVATAGAWDEEMRQRIKQHQRERPAGWRTLETQRNIGQLLPGRRIHHRDAVGVGVDDQQPTPVVGDGNGRTGLLHKLVGLQASLAGGSGQERQQDGNGRKV